MSSLIVALRFLTIVPVPVRAAAAPGALGRAAGWFPIVGLVLGAMLSAADWALLAVFPPTLAAVVVVAIWKVATGAIHLDGLADSLDALGGADRHERLAIARDSRIGVFGTAGLVLSLVGAIVALADLPPELRHAALVIAPAVGRMAPALAGTCFSLPAAPGLGEDFLSGLSRWVGPVQLLIAVGLVPLALGAGGAIVVAATVAAALVWSALMARRLGGLTGDALGGAVEVAELALLTAMAALAHPRRG